MTIRPAVDGDFEALVDLDVASARHHASIDPDLYHVPDRAAVAAFLSRRLVEHGEGQILVAEIDGAVVGMVGMSIPEPLDPGGILRPVPTADLGISVAEGWRGRGVGQALMAAAEAWARDHRIERIILDMSAANEGAFRFYQALGYRTYGLLMRKQLVRL
jgi:GNAT superfamily N-acetyltransferase